MPRKKSTSRSAQSKSSAKSSRRRFGGRIALSTVLAFAFALVVGAAVGGLGVHYTQKSKALDGDGCNSGSIYAYGKFWDGGNVREFPDKNSSSIGWMSPGCHAIFKQTQCRYKGQNLDGATVYDGPYHNNWWVYLPDRGGWVNEVLAWNGSNDQTSWPSLLTINPFEASCGVRSNNGS